MKFLIATTREDRSRDLLAEAGRKRDLDVTMLYYEDLDAGNLRGEDFSGYDYAILRDPFNTGTSFLLVLEKILSFLPEDRILDCSIIRDYMTFEDKLSQHRIFSDIARMPKFRHFSTPGEVRVDAFPVILKKRISSRGRGIYIIKTQEELERFLSEHDIDDFLIEDIIDIDKDIRVLMIGREVAGAVYRRVRTKDNHGYEGIGVKVMGGFDVPEDIRKKAAEISEKTGSDFCGLDFAIDKSGSAWLMECNVSPQFVAFENAMKSDAAGRLIDFILSKKG
ncbi:MAG: ATP-grasp domain-containing protein [Candidatus Aenigmarchaeota archaeon]|nr:ATP-grasp domain-containing protein [Candidatus Aenigmarchaeota archaeon]